MSDVNFSIVAYTEHRKERVEFTLTSIEPLCSLDKRLNAPCSVAITPSFYELAFRVLLDGKVLWGHIPFDADTDLGLIVAPSTFIAYLESEEFELEFSPEYEAYLKIVRLIY